MKTDSSDSCRACCPLNAFAANTSMDFGILLLRSGVGGMMLVHGLPKLMLLLSGNWATFPNPLGIGCFLSLLLCTGAEVLGSFCLIIGFLTRFAALSLCLNMCVALFLVLGLSGWGTQELAALYLLIYLVLFYTGGGRFSVDSLWIVPINDNCDGD